jgi:hypothetical protein
VVPGRLEIGGPVFLLLLHPATSTAAKASIAVIRRMVCPFLWQRLLPTGLRRSARKGTTGKGRAPWSWQRPDESEAFETPTVDDLAMAAREPSF